MLTWMLMVSLFPVMMPSLSCCVSWRQWDNGTPTARLERPAEYLKTVQTGGLGRARCRVPASLPRCSPSPLSWLYPLELCSVHLMLRSEDEAPHIPWGHWCSEQRVVAQARWRVSQSGVSV